MTFPGAVTDRESAAYVVVGAPLDATTTFQPGTRFGPELIRRFARTFDDYDRRTDARFTDLGVADAGDVPAGHAVASYLDHLAAELRAVRLDGAIPVTLGGEHTVSWAGVRATDPDVFVALDAHLDLRDAYDGNPTSHACVTRRILDGPRGAGGDDSGGGETTPTADRAVILGARTGSPEEWERAERGDVTVVPPEDVGDWEPSFGPDADVYLSVDIDGADPSVAPGTGTMEPFGLSARTMREVVRTVAGRCVGCDVVEVNDRDDGQAAALAGKLARAFVYEHAAES